MHHKAQNKNGFTLIELLVTICIVVILASVLFSGSQIFLEKAKITRVQTHDMRGLVNAIQLYKNDNGLYSWPIERKPYPNDHEYFSWYGPPNNEQGSKDVCKKLQPYNNDIKEDGSLKDPWGNQYAMKWDVDRSGKVEYYGTGFKENIPQTFIVVSLGKNKTQNNPLQEPFDDIYSFCPYKDKSLFIK